MRKEVISKCPVCSEELTISRLHCDNCGIEISGEFALTKLAKLSKEQLMFIEIFLKNQGSIKSVEKDMNISYPTVKKMLNEILAVLGYDKLEEDKVSIQRQEILERLASKEISFEEATALLKKL
ncbi:MAG TPA: DUF2089 domain-containing protein [Bacilli bacterium]|jgi:hypothetical protein|nr:DUF2089 domain-containing protein [Acholeplasmataceae bacterium]HNZ77559.1 DUF2089 domain-containing protein [Bacilli bacterium]HOD60554.1 DUF2089 domain-containing protein [Bacilli bacterium]HOH61784.1 DUF2089 domain-containing protein [Bacilli bacterium]HPB49160.1 DUF2089 domain-containing protein [Bacilli bacterium]